MLENQIFISYSSKNRDIATRLYNDLLCEGYPVWMDKALEEIKEWKPQIEDNLRKSNRFIVLISSHSVKSKWVLHEGSIAYALKQLIIPLKIEDFGQYLATDLPIWTEEKQLVNFVEGAIDYQNRLRRVKQYLGEPLPIQKHLEEMMIQYRTSGMLLSEVALNLIERHKDVIEFPEGSEELIEKSKRALLNFYTRYNELEKDYETTKKDYENAKKAYENAKVDIYNLNKKIESVMLSVKVRFVFLLFVCIISACYVIAVLFHIKF